MKIFIDPGHNSSSFNTGAAGNGLKEQDVTFNLASLLADKLTKQYGAVKVPSGKTSDGNPAVQVMLSRDTITTNLGTNNQTAVNTRWQLANAWQADYFISLHCNAGGGVGAEVLYRTGTDSAFAKTVLDAYIARTGIVSRGVKERADLAVLNNSKCPAILIEAGFIDNVGDASLFRDKLDLLADGILAGIVKHINLNPNQAPAAAASEVKEEKEMRYQSIKELPDWAKPTIQDLVNKGFLQGGDKESLNLSEDMVRMFVVLDRAGVL